MKLLLIRHADPDYSIDSLTPKGWREAECLADRLGSLRPAPAACYVSPLGRAKDTASLTLARLGQKATECDWLREFCAPVHKPDCPDTESIPWDWLPQDWLADERFLQPDAWCEPAVFAESGVAAEYARVTAGLDALLARHGYEREGLFYRPVRPGTDTVLLFCHFGVECVLLSHLLNLSPMVLWHGACAAPSSVTVLHTEQRRPGAAVFRMAAFGDTGHLYAKGEPPAFAARFCEVYGNGDRQD